MINYIRNLIEKTKIKSWLKQYENYEDTFEFIWGIKADDDFTSNEANLHTMNDLDIIYDKKTSRYTINVETIYEFTNGVQGAKNYMFSLLEKLTRWMEQQGYNTNAEFKIYDVFTYGIKGKREFESIEDLYKHFKFYVKGFINQ